jgi:HEPN domain-containing protein
MKTPSGVNLSITLSPDVTVRENCSMKDLDHARLMLNLARNDLAVMEDLRASRRAVAAGFGFHAQQAVEKALKAWLSLIGIAYPRTHVLRELIACLEDSGEAGVRAYVDLQDLSPFAVQFRYQDFPVEEELDREDVLRCVMSLIERVSAMVRDAEANE